jgi:hypothetical protein
MSGVRIPTVTGPIPISATSRPFTVEGVDLAEHDYTLDEHFVAGTANVYDWGADGKAPTPQVRTADAPYTTRIVVRRPVDPESFSGNVWVELNNPSRNYDVELEWPAAHRKFLRDRDVHVALTVKPVSIAALQRFDAERYAALSMANPLAPEQQSGGTLPGEAGYDENESRLYENGLCWDIISQIGALVREPGATGVLPGYGVRRVFATGVSQTGCFLNTWAAGFEPTARLADGRPVYDGIVSVISAGRTTPINQCVEATAADDPRSALPTGHVPFMRIDSQSEPLTLGGFARRRADSDAPDDPYRSYEIAGSAHGWSDIYNAQPPFADILAAGGEVLSFAGCVEDRWNSFPRQLVEPAMLANMERWVAEGFMPPRQSEPLRVRGGGTPDAAFETDEHGNALGGVRSPWVDVPVATYVDWATDREPGGFGELLGHEIRFASAKLETLYPSNRDYVAQVRAAVARMLDGGWVEPADAAAIVEQARYTAVP